jgi:hypothetical protein
MKLPVTFANPMKLPEVGMKIEHPAPVINALDVGLETVHVVAVAVKNEPSKETVVPSGPLVTWPTEANPPVRADERSWMNGPLVTLKMACAESPALPLT